MSRLLIVNADDLGASSGINRGIIESHTDGILTSASLMVTGKAVKEGAALAAEHPNLSVGLHLDLFGEDEREFDTHDVEAVREEFRLQADMFCELLGRFPTHIDSHRHVHREPQLMPLARQLAHGFDVPLRGDGRVTFIGGFYAQWQWGVTELEHVSVRALRRILAEEVGEGWTEISCHPGYHSPDYQAMYLAEREAEVRTLTAPEILDELVHRDINLAGYAAYGRERGRR